MTPRRSLAVAALSFCLFIAGPPALRLFAAPATPRVDVILWFDTEDYMLPASDDAAKRLATMLTERGVRATFKVVGEKARTLERRGRQDVIDALKQHSIAFHSDFHSVHPTPTEYLADCGLLDGIAEFIRREGRGASDVRRIFGVDTLSCYGQPGSSWAPQTVAALKDVGVAPGGVPCYVDEGNHVGLDGKPFWYAGALNVYHMAPNYTRMELHDADAVEPGKRKVSAIAARLARTDGGGLISIFYHPCEWVHEQFWDGVNFARGANPPREQWKAPPQRPAAQTEAAFQRFGEYIDHIKSIPGVRFVTAADLPAMYPDRVRAEGASEAELQELAKRLRAGAAGGIDFQRVGGKVFSPADQFELLLGAVGEWGAGRRPQFPIKSGGLLGPDAFPPTDTPERRLDAAAFKRAVLDARDFVRTQRRVPARVFVGADAVSPAAFLVAMANALEGVERDGRLPTDGVLLPKPGEVLPARRVAADTPELFGDWIIHREGFRAPRVLEVARLQAWTLKPARRAD